MRKSIVLCCSIVLVLSLALPYAQAAISPELQMNVNNTAITDVVSLAATCNPHQFRKINTPIREEWVSISGTMHELRTYYKAACDECGATTTFFESSNASAHTMMSNGDRHLNGKNLHEYYRKCSRCGQAETIKVGCVQTENGSCPNPFNGTDPDHETH